MNYDEVQITTVNASVSLAAGETVAIRPVSVAYAGTDATTLATYQGTMVLAVTVRATAAHNSAAYLVSVGSGSNNGRTVSTETPIVMVLQVGQYLSPPTIEIRNTGLLIAVCDLAVDIVSA